jgi:hypothetical protein
MLYLGDCTLAPWQPSKLNQETGLRTKEPGGGEGSSTPQLPVQTPAVRTKRFPVPSSLYPMHGHIFMLLRRYVQTQYDHSTWLKLMKNAGLETLEFDHKTVYPDQHIYDLVGQAAEMTGIPAGELHEKFGEYLVPDLMFMYQRYIQPEWKTLDMIENTEMTMHKQVRREHAENRPPVLEVQRVNKDELFIDYVSKRRMSGLAVGIVRGLATYFDEADRIEVLPTTREEDEHVRIHVRRR